MHKFLRIIFIFSLNGSVCFGLSLVHHQEQHLISCTAQLVHSCRYVWLLYGYRKDCSPSVSIQLIKCCSWWWTNDSPKHIEPFNEKIKIIHKNFCIPLVYIHISIWCTVHTTSDNNSNDNCSFCSTFWTMVSSLPNRKFCMNCDVFIFLWLWLR